ncbi:MAG: two-component regulator propeller domain-containing protein, partial [Pseudomonadota bacterium]
MRFPIGVIVVIACALASLTATGAKANLASPADPPTHVFTVADGLNQQRVLDIAQDADGYLWVATFGGINRIDGKHFESFTTSDGLRENLMISLTVDDHNRLWGGDADGGLTLIENGRVTRTFDQPSGATGGGIRAMAQHGDVLYLATDSGGLQRVHLSDLDAGIQRVPDSPVRLLGIAAGDAKGVYLQSREQELYYYEPNRTEPFTLLA